ncbi:hypothetical protein [Moraxella lacunata]
MQHFCKKSSGLGNIHGNFLLKKLLNKLLDEGLIVKIVKPYRQ